MSTRQTDNWQRRISTGWRVASSSSSYRLHSISTIKGGLPASISHRMVDTGYCISTSASLHSNNNFAIGPMLYCVFNGYNAGLSSKLNIFFVYDVWCSIDVLYHALQSVHDHVRRQRAVQLAYIPSQRPKINDAGCNRRQSVSGG